MNASDAETAVAVEKRQCADACDVVTRSCLVDSMRGTDGLGRHGQYTGETLDSLPHGEGTMTYDDNSDIRTYSGSWANGHWDGSGRVEYSDGRVYAGAFLETKRHGHGVYTWTNGAVYDGEFCNDERHGDGMYQVHEKTVYKGEWQHGAYHGQGTYVCDHGSWRHQGLFANGKPHGHGVRTQHATGTVLREGLWDKGEPNDIQPPDTTSCLDTSIITVVEAQDWRDVTSGVIGTYRGLWDTRQNAPVGNGTIDFSQGNNGNNNNAVVSYEGCFDSDGYYHGHGRLYCANGDAYEGEFCRGERTGVGSYWWKDGRHYQGEFRQNQRHGTGKYFYPNNDFYEGSFQHGKRSGHGKFVFCDGSTYNGNWKNGFYHGEGALISSDGTTYTGQFEQGLAHGLGTKTGPDGNVIYRGIWVRGEQGDRVATASVRPSDAAPMDGIVHSTTDTDFKSSVKATLQIPLSSASLYGPRDLDLIGGGLRVSDSDIEVDCEAVVDQPVQDGQGNWGKYTGIVTKSSHQPHGVGRMVYDDGKRIHDGFWEAGNKQGHGRCLFFPQEHFHEGEYKNNLRHGYGRYVWKDGRCYTGDYFDDMRHGQGTYVYPSGDKYQGSFERGVRSGHGTFVFESGKGRYKGEWKGGKYCGTGCLIWGSNDAFTYEGEFDKGMFHGDGTLKEANGKIIQQGKWIEGNFQGQCNQGIHSKSESIVVKHQENDDEPLQFETRTAEMLRGTGTMPTRNGLCEEAHAHGESIVEEYLVENDNENLELETCTAVAQGGSGTMAASPGVVSSVTPLSNGEI
jgi:hypothetical protein